ncbi:DUF4124 domain-containing protein [Chitinibacter sp. S2-10]|uniref:DUF4124 domain-containing protein n=1 Tax=Chitinibacter sp. S2-10 TaxID=3373597 RepID=UPI003977892E
MKKKWFIVVVLLLSVVSAWAGKVYQWRDADGKVFYSDQPPPIAGVKERQIRPNTVGNASQPQAAVSAKETVILWVNANCRTECNQAIALLDQRAVPYEVKNADPKDEKSMLAFFNAVGTLQAKPPVLIIGKDVYKEWNSPLWQGALSKAGYPLPQPKK